MSLDPIWYWIAALFGLIIGSFLNVLVLRDTRRRTILTGRSACPHCKHVLQWYELVPLLSFVVQGGKCRSCSKRLSWQYPLGELLSSLLAVFALWYGYGEQGSLLYAVLLYAVSALYLVMAMHDVRTMLVRPEYALLAGVLASLANGWTGVLSWENSVIGGVAGAGIIASLSYGWKLLTGRQGMGDGDIYIAGAVGLLVGWPNVLAALFFAVALGSVVGVPVAAAQHRGLAIEMPFGPFLFAGGLLALVWAAPLIAWYWPL
jgi:leader peptidase (prepilin peptidase)/N-methyltransferase